MKNDLISRQEAIDVEGLDEQIRCEICRNPMHTNRGCDGNCKYDEKLYERIMQILGERIKPSPSAEPEIIHCKNCKHRESNDCPMYYEEWIEIDEGDGYFDTDNIIHDWTTDEGFCYCAELRGKEE